MPETSKKEKNEIEGPEKVITSVEGEEAISAPKMTSPAPTGSFGGDPKKNAAGEITE